MHTVYVIPNKSVQISDTSANIQNGKIKHAHIQ